MSKEEKEIRTTRVVRRQNEGRMRRRPSNMYRVRPAT